MIHWDISLDGDRISWNMIWDIIGCMTQMIYIYVYIYDICIIMMYHPRFGISLEYDGDIISLDIISVTAL